MQVSHIGICVSDWERSLGFYRDHLGFRESFDLAFQGEPSATLLGIPDVDFRAIYLEKEGLVIELLHYASPGCEGDAEPRPMNRLGITHFSFRVDDLDAFVEKCEADGIPVLSRTRIEVPGSSTKAIFITDPDGTRIELVERPGD